MTDKAKNEKEPVRDYRKGSGSPTPKYFISQVQSSKKPLQYPDKEMRLLAKSGR